MPPKHATEAASTCSRSELKSQDSLLTVLNSLTLAVMQLANGAGVERRAVRKTPPLLAVHRHKTSQLGREPPILSPAALGHNDLLKRSINVATFAPVRHRTDLDRAAPRALTAAGRAAGDDLCGVRDGYAHLLCRSLRVFLVGAT